MYLEHPSFITPPDDTIIWRYMDFTKFSWLISQSHLYFPSAFILAQKDPFEGSPGPLNLAYETAVEQAKDFVEENAADIIHEEMLQDLRFLKSISRTTYINSWYMSPNESAAMWELYSRNEGIAIKSTIGQLKEALKTNDNIFYI